MPVSGDKPVVEQITAKIATQVALITGDEGYLIDVLKVVRPTRRNDYTANDGTLVLLLESFEPGDSEISATSIALERTAVWTLDYFIEPGDGVTTPIDQLQAIAVAEIERALAGNFAADPRHAFDGLGYNAELRPPQLISSADGATTGVRVNLAITYRHTETDPYNEST